MDLLLIPVLLLIGGTLIYIGANGMPDMTLSAMPLRRNREPFLLKEWMHSRPGDAKNRTTVSKLEAGEHDAELVELMNEMIAVREDLTALKRRMTGKAPRRVEAVIHTEILEEEPEVIEEAAVAAIIEEAPVAEKAAVEKAVEQPVVEKAAVKAVEKTAVDEKPVREAAPVVASTKLPHPVKATSMLPPELLKQQPLVADAKAAEKVERPIANPALTFSASLERERSRVEKPARAEAPAAEEPNEEPLPIAASRETKVEKPEVAKPAYKQENREKVSSRVGHTRRYARI